ncbi:MAG: hypothetical protein P8R54_00915 [Myxococcota bacterium]|nr:hypothetical protein [Myxococcota bacterium]
MLLLFLACNTPTDAEHYLAATADPGNPARCEPIGDPWLAGECHAMAAAWLIEHSDTDAGLAVCGALPPGDTWRDECFFLLSDRMSAAGDQARQVCAQSGQFQDRCLGHAFGREGRAMLQEVATGEERDVYRALRVKSAEYFDDQQTASKKLWHMMIEFVASRDIQQPFSAATCGGLPRRICQTGFQTRIRFMLRDAGGSKQTLHTLCNGQPVEVGAAIALGGPSWEADADALVQEGWRQFCRR